MTPETLLTLLAVRLEHILARASIPDEKVLWTTRDIAVYIKRTPKQITQRYTCLPDFPLAIRLPSGDTGSAPGHKRGGAPLWHAAEVIAWAEKYREKRPS